FSVIAANTSREAGESGMKIDLQTVVLLGVVAFLAMRGCEPANPPGPGPEPTEPVDGVAEDAAQAYLAALAEASERSAADPAATSVEHGERLHAATERARKAAFAPYNAAADRVLGGDRYTPEKAAEFDAAAAKGFR